ncbi:MAG: hypothetical protein KME46_21905 [Brasilonema angustatum HA4187-MV1]|jgi:hypothetical protein|nr:hypothetical protein [Brasilonema angustatum HA4187-MV1]
MGKQIFDWNQQRDGILGDKFIQEIAATPTHVAYDGHCSQGALPLVFDAANINERTVSYHEEPGQPRHYSFTLSSPN